MEASNEFIRWTYASMKIDGHKERASWKFRFFRWDLRVISIEKKEEKKE